MMSRGSRTTAIACIGIGVMTLAGCNASRSVREQSEEVAKNWSYVIRASQVMPVYPLMEDLQPGDVFLVEVPLQDEVSTWNERGYLPLSNHLARLGNLEGLYESFYQSGYWQGTYAAVPHARPKPAEAAAAQAAASAAPPATGGAPAPLAAPRRFSSAEAPLAAFPTYSFDVTRSGGLALALPVQGIPIAMGLAGAERAQASVTLSDAIAYGLATNELFEALDAWSYEPEVRALLSVLHDQAANRTDPRRSPLFLRVISRVYFVGAVNVTVNTTETLGGDVRGGSAAVGAGGVAKISMPDLATRDAVQSYNANLAALSSAISSTLPGGEIRFGYIADNSVSLAESFPRPLAIGFIGFDVPILEGGVLGVPIATRTRIDDPGVDSAQPAPMGTVTPDMRNYALRMQELQRLAVSPEVADQTRAIAAVRATAGDLGNRPTMAELGAWLAANPAAPAPEVVDRFVFAASAIGGEGGGNMRGYREVVAAIDRALSK